MYVCVCSAVTEQQIHQAAHQGATMLKGLRRDLDVATDGGRCANCARQCLRGVQVAQANIMSLAVA